MGALVLAGFLQGFVAKPETLPDGTVNLMVWKCVIPGKQGVRYRYDLVLSYVESSEIFILGYVPGIAWFSM
jgi:hypothetical protein